MVIKDKVHRQDDEMRDQDKINKWKGKEKADIRRKSRESEIHETDWVLVRQEKKDKLSTPFHPVPMQVLKKTGNSVTVQTPSGKELTRNSTFMRKYVPYNIPYNIQKETDGTNRTLEGINESVFVPGETEKRPATSSRPKRTIKVPQRYGY